MSTWLSASKLNGRKGTTRTDCINNNNKNGCRVIYRKHVSTAKQKTLKASHEERTRIF